jgi:phosphoribosylaminoimidazole-succinocarboxamide synthase
MAKIPEKVKNAFIIKGLEKYLQSQGKVRDIYRVPISGKYAKLLLATDRISIFDFVLPALIPSKGEVLTALSHFWMTKVLKKYPNHLFVAKTGSPGKPDFAASLLNNHAIPSTRCLAVKELEIMKYELIFRGHLGGSVYKKYLETGTVAGEKLPPGIPKWTKLDTPLFTPSTKEDDGHDVNITAEEFYQSTGDKGVRAVKMLGAVYAEAYKFAKKKGLLILDTKFEVGIDERGNVIIADEVLTPDSSRYTTPNNFKEAVAEKREPIFYDKETVRIWGKEVKTPFMGEDNLPIIGIDKLDPRNEEHVKFVHSLSIHKDIILDTTSRYQLILYRIAGHTLRDYQKSFLI